MLLLVLTLNTNSKTASGRRKRTDKEFVNALNLLDPTNKIFHMSTRFYFMKSKKKTPRKSFPSTSNFHCNFSSITFVSNIEEQNYGE